MSINPDHCPHCNERPDVYVSADGVTLVNCVNAGCPARDRDDDPCTLGFKSSRPAGAELTSKDWAASIDAAVAAWNEHVAKVNDGR
jgi:hypothetical protein